MKKAGGNAKQAEVQAKNYILEYYQAITDGSVTVGHWIREWYSMIISGLQEKRFFFNQKKANLAIRFIQTFCRHHEGALAPGQIRLELWQKAMISVIFGIVDENGIRVFREILIIMGRKNGKTLLAACIMALILYLDPDYGKRVYTVATRLDQARLCYEALYQMIRKEPELAEITQKRRTDLYVKESNSSAMPIAFSEKKSDGFNPSGVICDELGAWQGEQGLRQYQVMKSALGARQQPLLVSITTAGYVSDGIYDEMIQRGTAVIKSFDCDGEIVKANLIEMEYEPSIIYTGSGPTKTMSPRPKETIETIPLPTDVDSDIHNLFRNFLDVIDGKAERIIKLDEVRRVLEVIEAIFESAEKGKAVSLQ